MRSLCFAIPLGLALSGCAAEAPVVDASAAALLVPVGRACLAVGACVLSVNDVARPFEPVLDGLGGSWIRIPFAQMEGRTKVALRIVRRRENVGTPFRESVSDDARWLRPATLIDADHPSIVSAAASILAACPSCASREDRARRIQEFVIGHLTMRSYDGPPTWKASAVYERRFGVCIDFARLFVALARAAGVPARSVEGIVQNPDDPRLYDGHHEWAEIMDEGGSWHALDFTYSTAFDLRDIRYLDLVYASEENPRYKAFFETDYRPYRTDDGDVVVFSVQKTEHGAYPGLGYRLLENRHPDSYTLENAFYVELREGRVHVTR